LIAGLGRDEWQRSFPALMKARILLSKFADEAQLPPWDGLTFDGAEPYLVG
jgi:hypothetical protein